MTSAPPQVSLTVWDDVDIVHVVPLTDPDRDGIYRGSFKGTDEELQAIIDWLGTLEAPAEAATE